MTLGAGKYDDLLTAAREGAKATSAVLIVLDGEKGPGFSCQAPLAQTLTLPAILRFVADQVEADLRAGRL
jgi:hypothetical protein